MEISMDKAEGELVRILVKEWAESFCENITYESNAEVYEEDIKEQIKQNFIENAKNEIARLEKENKLLAEKVKSLEKTKAKTKE